MELMESLIQRHRYYDGLGVWSPFIDLDKEITAALVRGLGAHSCFELGCYTGPVLSLLAEAGVDVLGAEVSHTALEPTVSARATEIDWVSVRPGGSAMPCAWKNPSTWCRGAVAAPGMTRG